MRCIQLTTFIKTAALFLVIAIFSSNVMSVRAETNLRVAINGLPPSQFNPYRNTGLPYVYTWSAVFDGLTAIDASGNVQPALATSWENIDPLTWIFRLREDVTFSNGRPFTADAVVNAVNFLSGEEAMREVVARMMFFLESARAIDDFTVEIKTSVPTPLLPRFFPQLYMVEPDYFQAVGLQAFSEAPIATGPFIVEEVRPERVDFRGFKKGWRPPVADRLEIMTVPDNATRALSVQAGRFDIALQLGPDESKAIQAQGGTQVTWRDAAVWAYNFFPEIQPALKDVRVREALNIAVDRDAIIAALLDGATIPATQPAPPEVYGYNADLPAIPYDPDRSRRLLREAGYGEGFKLEMEAVSGSSANDSAVNLTVAQYLDAIGVEMEIRTITVNQLIRNVVEGTWTGSAFALHFNFEPTSDVLRALDIHSCLWANPWYCNEAVMPLIAAAQTELDPVLNLSLRRDIMRFYREDWAALYMYQAPRFAGTAPGVTGLNVVNNVIAFDRIVPGQVP
jgi:peptide/nickel transport system substrate-binding protein